MVRTRAQVKREEASNQEQLTPAANGSSATTTTTAAGVSTTTASAVPLTSAPGSKGQAFDSSSADRNGSGSQSSTSDDSDSVVVHSRKRKTPSTDLDDPEDEPNSSSSSSRSKNRTDDESSSVGESPPKRRKTTKPAAQEPIEEERFETGSLDRPKGAKFRNVPEGAGHTYTFDLTNADRIRWIGTTGCNTCVGIYFAISEEKCFVGHWNYDLHQRSAKSSGKGTRRRLRGLATESFRDAEEYLVGDHAFDWIRRDVKQKLADWQWACGWGPVTTRMRASLLMVCPHCNSGDKSRRYVGDAVVAGVKEFLCIIDDDLQPVKVKGFIVEHDGSRRPAVLFFDSDNPGEGSLRWRRYNHESNQKCEVLDVRDDRSFVQEMELDDPLALGETEEDAMEEE